MTQVSSGINTPNKINRSTAQLLAPTCSGSSERQIRSSRRTPGCQRRSPSCPHKWPPSRDECPAEPRSRPGCGPWPRPASSRAFSHRRAVCADRSGWASSPPAGQQRGLFFEMKLREHTKRLLFSPIYRLSLILKTLKPSARKIIIILRILGQKLAPCRAA